MMISPITAPPRTRRLRDPDGEFHADRARVGEANRRIVGTLTLGVKRAQTAAHREPVS